MHKIQWSPTAAWAQPHIYLSFIKGGPVSHFASLPPTPPPTFSFVNSNTRWGITCNLLLQIHEMSYKITWWGWKNTLARLAVFVNSDPTGKRTQKCANWHKYTTPLRVCPQRGNINILQATQHFSISCLGSSWRDVAVSSTGLVPRRRKSSMHFNSCLWK